MLDEALWVPGMSCAILANDRETSDKIFQIVKRAFSNLPKALKPFTKTDTKRTYEFTANWKGEQLDSSIYVATHLRGGTVRRLHITESAYHKDRQELNSGSKQAVPMDGYISEETTGNGFNAFFDFFEESDSIVNPGPLDYRTYFYPWFENPEYRIPGTIPEEQKTKEELYLQQSYPKYVDDSKLLWRRWKVKELRTTAANDGIKLNGEQLFKQEYPSNKREAFQSAAGNVFNIELLDTYHPKQPLTREQLQQSVRERYQILKIFDENLIHDDIVHVINLANLGLNIWKLPIPGHTYVLGCDPSDGEGSDYSSFSLWDFEELEQVAQFYGKIRPDELAEVIKQSATYYNKAFVGVENNMLSTILFLSKIYDNYFYEVKIDEKINKKTKKLGWNTNGKTRDPMIDDFIVYFEEGHLKINSIVTMREMRTFVRKENGKREHADGKHDDALFGDMIALQMRKYKKPEPRIFSQKPEGW